MNQTMVGRTALKKAMKCCETEEELRLSKAILKSRPKKHGVRRHKTHTDDVRRLRAQTEDRKTRDAEEP